MPPPTLTVTRLSLLITQLLCVLLLALHFDGWLLFATAAPMVVGAAMNSASIFASFATTPEDEDA